MDYRMNESLKSESDAADMNPRNAQRSVLP
jgi:hypothetical protein